MFTLSSQIDTSFFFLLYFLIVSGVILAMQKKTRKYKRSGDGKIRLCGVVDGGKHRW